MALMSAAGRRLTTRDLPALQRLFDRDPVAHCFVASRLAEGASNLNDMWGWYEDDALLSAIYYGANLVPIETSPAARAGFVAVFGSGPRRCSSLVGPAAEVLDLWDQLSPTWGDARDVRSNQLLMAIAERPHVLPHPGVRPIEPVELDLLDPAYVAMFTEEVGVAPSAGGVGRAYRNRLAALLVQHRSVALFQRGGIVFKAELGAITPTVTQVQGVWVEPKLRRKGLGTSGMAAVVTYARANFAPVVSLYVNDYNTAAVEVYDRVGFSQVGTFATVLF
ncbi:MAG: GNAT family N-acetyltransferase [Candidatus Nanopelagicales bacterium]